MERGYKNLGDLSRRQLKRVMTRAITEAADGSKSQKIDSGCSSSSTANTLSYSNSGVTGVEQISLPLAGCGENTLQSCSNVPVINRKTCPGSVDSVPDRVPTILSQTFTQSSQCCAQTQMDGRASVLNSSNLESVADKSQCDDVLDSSNQSNVDVSEFIHMDCSFENFVSICDVCESCCSCACLLSCGECEHHPPPAICVHCLECSAKHGTSSSDNCERCCGCSCFLSCGLCEHFPPPAACVHCTECSGRYDPSAVINSDDTESDNELSNSLPEDLAEWAVQDQITHASLKRLLNILNQHHPEDNLPKDPRTLLKTARKVVLREVPPGQYWHNGLKKNLIARFSDSEEQKINLTFNVDGLPISSSSNSALWPILCCVEGTNDVFAVGIYHGYAKPESESVYLEELVEEVTDLILNGLDIGGKHFEVCVSCYICDAPAKSFCFCTKGHNGYFSCSKCFQKGRMFGSRMSYPDIDFVKRSDESFISQEQPEHHTGKPKLLEIPGIKPVSDVVLDPMHLLYLGVMKKLLMFWLFGDRSIKMGKNTCDEISTHLVQLQSFVPEEFARKPRSLEFVCRYKATEFREILFYIGPVVFKKLKREVYENFLVFHVAARLLNSPETCITLNEYAGDLMKNFVENFKTIYGEQFVSHNVHGCLHVHEDVLRHGPLERYSAFKFENFLQKLKGLVRKGEKPLQQIVKRYSEMERVILKNSKKCTPETKFLHEHNDGPLVEGCGYPQYKQYKLSNALVNVQRKGDCCVSLKDGSIVVVTNFAHHDASGQMKVIGRKFRYKDNLYKSPIESSRIGIFKVYGQTGLQSWPVDKISHKLFRMPYKDGKYAVVPLLH